MRRRMVESQKGRLLRVQSTERNPTKAANRGESGVQLHVVRSMRADSRVLYRISLTKSQAADMNTWRTPLLKT